jgi:glyoxylase-like metal-dependent hydrolase (beta-lactamase superfamily II)
MEIVVILVSGFGIIGIVGLSGKYLLLDRGSWPGQSEYRVDLEEVRALARAESDALPIRVNSVVIAEGEFPKWAVVAGGSTQAYPTNFTSFQVVYGDKTVIIDAPFNKAQFEKLPFGTTFHEERFAAMQQAMQQAEQIVVTHEHGDHIGGIAQSPVLKQIWPNVLLTKEQIHSPTIKDAQFPDGLLETASPLEYETYHRLAPGIVLIKAPGHRPGHQMVYIQLQNGKELLVIGDVVWNEANLKRQTARPLLVSLFLRQNRTQVTHQMRWLHDAIYQNAQEAIHLVISHDPEQRQRYLHQGLLGDAFEF